MQIVTVEIHPIATAPHERLIRIYRPRRGWCDGWLNESSQFWSSPRASIKQDREDAPTYWHEPLPRPVEEI
jgi:hypothetical protein